MKSKEDICVACEDGPVSYCPKCRKFFVLDKNGNRTQLSIKENEDRY